MLLHIHEAIRRLPHGSVFPSAESARLERALEGLVGRRAARRLLAATGEVGAFRMPAPELAAAADIPLRAAERVVAARAFSECATTKPAKGLRGAADAQKLLPRGFATLETEVLLGLALTARMTLKSTVLFAKGGDVGCSVSVRDVFVPLIRLSAAAFVLCHNHPSGECAPSEADVELTNRVATAGKLLGIELVDHLIVSTTGTLSFYETGLLPTPSELAN